MDYFVIRRATPEGAPRELEINPRPTYNQYAGEKVAIPPSGSVVTISKLKGILDIWWMGSNFLMSHKALDIVKEIGDTHFEAFPVTLAAKSGKRDDQSTQIVNLLDNVSCMNKKASKFDVDEDNKNYIDTIHKLVLDKTKIPPERHLFRLGEEETVIIACSELVDKWKAIQVRGVKFVKSEEYKS